MSATKFYTSSVGVARHLLGALKMLQKYLVSGNNIAEFVKTSFQQIFQQSWLTLGSYFLHRHPSTTGSSCKHHWGSGSNILY